MSIDEASVVSLLGPSGCGKTTLLRTILGFNPATAGTVERPPLAACRIVWQRPVLQPWHTATQHIAEALEISGVVADPMDALQDVHLREHAALYPWQMSGGMRQRLALACALSTRPRLLLMDEPFSGVDEVTRSFIYDVLWKYIREMPASALVVTHSVEEAVSLSTTVLVLSGSRPTRIVVAEQVPRGEAPPSLWRDAPTFALTVSLVRSHLWRDPG